MKNEFKVFFSGNFWGHRPYERAGKKIMQGLPFCWAGYDWVIPGVYTTSKGVVADICRKISKDSISAYYDKWDNDNLERLDSGQREQLKRESPFELSVDFAMQQGHIDGVSKRSCSVIWQPCQPDHNGKESNEVMEAYGLDQDCGWVICRVAFPWKGKKKPRVNELTLTLSMENQFISCNSDFTTAVGCDPFDVKFLHPDTGEVYHLHVASCERFQLPKRTFSHREWIFPDNGAALTYAITPEISREMIEIRDRNLGDKPISNTVKYGASCSAIGIIGGCDGPSAIFLASKEVKCHTIPSSFHFEPLTEVTWGIRMKVERIKPLEIVMNETGTIKE